MAKPELYNDGIAVLCRDAAGESSFGGRINPATAEDLPVLARLCFGECACRGEDLTFAQQQGFSLARKVRTPLPQGVQVDTGCYCLIGSTLYKVSRVDFNRPRRQMYLYLEEVGPIAG